jgi:hypothetical protein
MAWDDSSEAYVGATGEIYVANVGATAPTSTTSTLNPATWYGLGLTTEDGPTFRVEPEVTEFRAWQAFQAIRRERTGENVEWSAALEQWNEATLPFALGGGTITSDGGSGYKFTPAEVGDAVDERACIIDIADGTRKTRFYFPRGTVTEAVETQFQRTELAVLPITFRALRPADNSSTYKIFFDDAAAFAAGS